MYSVVLCIHTSLLTYPLVSCTRSPQKEMKQGSRGRRKHEEVLVVAERVVAVERAEERWPVVKQPPVTSLWAGTCHSGMRTFPAVPSCSLVLVSSFAFKMLRASVTPTLHRLATLANGDPQSSDLSCFFILFFLCVMAANLTDMRFGYLWHPCHGRHTGLLCWWCLVAREHILVIPTIDPALR